MQIESEIYTNKLYFSISIENFNTFTSFFINGKINQRIIVNISYFFRDFDGSFKF